MTSNFTPNSSQSNTHSNGLDYSRSNRAPLFWLKASAVLSIVALTYGGWTLFQNLEQNIKIPFYESPIALSIIGLQLVTAFSFCLWLFKSASNAKILKPDIDLPEPRAIIFSLFIPIVHFVLPCYHVTQIASNSSKRKNFTELVLTWWISWLIYFASVTVVLLPMEQKKVEAAAYGVIIGGIICNISLALLIHLVTASQARRLQRARARA